MECLHCKGRMERGTAPFSVDRHGYHVRWDAIAAWVCTQPSGLDLPCPRPAVPSGH